MKLSSKFSILFAIFSFLLVLIGNLISFFQGRDAILQDLYHHLETTSLYKQDEILRWADNISVKIENIAQRPLVIQYTREIIESNPGSASYQSAYFNLIEDHFTPLLKDNNFISFFIMSIDTGEILISSDESLVGKLRNSEDVFLQGMKQTYLDEMVFYPPANQVLMSISTPILDENDNLVAVLGGHLNTEILSEITRQGKEILPNEETYLVNDAFFFITKPWVNEAESFVNTARTKGVSECLLNRNGIEYYKNYRDIDVIGNYQWISELNACILTEINKETAFRPINNLQINLWIFGVLSAIVMAIVGSLIARDILTPVKVLIMGLSEISEKNYSYQIEINRSDEFSFLASSFNSMANNLKTSHEEINRLYKETLKWSNELESRVKERSQELSQSEEKFRLATTYAPFPIMIFNDKGEIYFINKTWINLSEFSLEETPTIEDWIKNSLLTNIDIGTKYFYDVFKTNAAKEMGILKIETKSGKFRNWMIHSTPLGSTNDDSKIAAIMAVDFTEQFNAYLALTESERKYRLLTESSPDLVFLLDQDYNLSYANNRLFELFNLDPNTSINKNIRNSFPFPISQRFLKKIDEVIKNRNQRSIQNNFSFNDHNIWLDTLIVPISKEDQPFQEVLCISRDITNQKKLELEIQEREQKFRLLAENSIDVIWQMDLTMRFSYVSPSIYNLTGFTPEEWVGTRLSDHSSSEEFRKMSMQILKALKDFVNFESTVFEARMIKKDGHEVDVEIVVRLIKNEEGFPVAIQGSTRNIAERKISESILNNTMSELRRSNNDLQQFANVASHDLQEPLRMVSSYIQLLEQEYSMNLDEIALEYMNFAVDGARRMKELLNDLLNYSRINPKEEEFTKVSINEVVNDSLQQLDLLIQENNAKIYCDNLPEIYGNETQILQLFQNLIGNAIKFRREAPPEIRISSKSITTDNKKSMWQFSITDNGIGIDSEYFNKIFVVFQRLHTQQDIPGNGIGLSICKKIVERHGGTIWVESEPGVGSTFHFTFPHLQR